MDVCPWTQAGCLTYYSFGRGRGHEGARMKSEQEIPNFDKLCELLKKSDQNPENLGYIHEMMELDGYEEWREWMILNRPDQLP